LASVRHGGFKHRVIGHGQKRLTENTFKEYGINKYKILVMHHHLLPIPIGGLEENIINDVEILYACYLIHLLI